MSNSDQPKRKTVWVDVDIIERVDAYVSAVAAREGVHISRNQAAGRLLLLGLKQVEAAKQEQVASDE